MDGPSRVTRLRNFMAAGVIAVALGAGGYLLGRGSVEALPPPAPEAPVVIRNAQPVQVPDVLLQRADLIRLATASADAAAGGPKVEDSLAGRRFVIRIPFGCAGPTPDPEAPFGWSYDAEQQTLRVRVTPQQWAEVPWVAGKLQDRDVESVEGFWLPRPWTRSEACPAQQSASPGERASSLGIAQFFAAGSSRVGRHEELELVERVPPEELRAGAGFLLLLEGRVARVPGGEETVLCHAAGAYERPICLVAAEFDRVAIENPATQQTLAQWQL